MNMIDELPSALRDALGQVIADQRREWRRERELLEAQSRETISLLRAENVELRETAKREHSERLASLRDGRDGEPGKDADLSPVLAEFEQIKAGALDRVDELCRRVDARLADVKDGEPGRDADLAPIVAEFDQIKSLLAEHMGRLTRELTDKVNAKLAEVKNGEPGRDGADGQRGETGQRGADGAPGKLSIVREWAARVHYEGDCVAHNGSTYQAVRATGGEPPGQDWVLIAAKGEDARPLRIRGTFDASAQYGANDIVALNGSSFVALRDAPGECPGEGWQLVASAGRRGQKGQDGERGERGLKGEQGARGASIIAGSFDADTMRMTFVDDEGGTVEVDMYSLAEAVKS